MADMVCADCGSRNVFAVAPGQHLDAPNPEVAATPVKAWCLSCWSGRFAAEVPKPRVRRRAQSKQSLD
jgi:hypothetical protein